MRSSLTILLIATFALCIGCSRSNNGSSDGPPTSLSQVPAVRLNFRYEADVPPPDAPKDATKEDRIAAVQSDFDANRPQEVLDKTIASPDAKRVLAVYHKAGDMPSEFRLDMYTGDGRILKKVTADVMAVHFPDTIRWSPDSSTLAFVAMIRGAAIDDTSTAPVADPETSIASSNSNANPSTIPPDTNANVDANVNSSGPAPTPAAPTGILTFRTEQIYICNMDGDGAKPITQNEGLIYFYYVWSPDSSALAALASKSIEWKYLNDRADQNGETFVPFGRPRVIEKNGRERRLDDALTAVQPVWTPDSSKVACAFDYQVRIYDAAGNSPTQAAIPLRNSLLISSQAYDREQAAKLEAIAPADANGVPAVTPNTNAAAPTTLPDEKTLVSYNPIVSLNWTADDLLYFQTAYIKRMKNEGDSVTSFQRWHRLVLTPQMAGR